MIEQLQERAYKNSRRFHYSNEEVNVMLENYKAETNRLLDIEDLMNTYIRFVKLTYTLIIKRLGLTVIEDTYNEVESIVLNTLYNNTNHPLFAEYEFKISEIRTDLRNYYF